MRSLLRVTMVCLAVSTAVIAVQGTVAPRSFYDGFPFGRGWVELLPPYNEHLIRDVGGFYLAFTILFVWAAVTLARALIVPLCVAWAVFSLVHGIFHALHLDGFSAGDAVAEIGGLAAVLVLPLLAIWVVRRDVTDLAV
ncbi:hypothetical protein [Solirubrobacter soli]|uniref:hypothetical protein n=1 Tax=Solirubrobacter soli TaxID=363832 RepID=UPI00069FC414|nr:hypothetical protein [Solirubrobacter soli]